MFTYARRQLKWHLCLLRFRLELAVLRLLRVEGRLPVGVVGILRILRSRLETFLCQRTRLGPHLWGLKATTQPRQNRRPFIKEKA